MNSRVEISISKTGKEIKRKIVKISLEKPWGIYDTNDETIFEVFDGDVVIYYPPLLVLPSYQDKGVGRLIIDKMQEIYKGFHMQMFIADGNAIDFYKRTILNELVKQSRCGSILVLIIKFEETIKLDSNNRMIQTLQISYSNSLLDSNSQIERNWIYYLISQRSN